MLLHNLLGFIGILVFLTNASPLDSPNRLEKRVIATTSCTQDNYYSTVHSSCYSSSFTIFCSSFLRSTVTGAPTTTVTQTVTTTTGAAVKVVNAAGGMLDKRAACTSFNVQWPRTAASSACSCLLTQSPPPITVSGGIATQTVTVTVHPTTSTGKPTTAPTSSTSPINYNNCPATKTNVGTCVSPSPVQNPFFANGLTGWTVTAQGGSVAVTTNCPDPNGQYPGQDLTHCLAVQFATTGGVVKLSQTVNPCVGQEYWWGTYQAQFAAQDADASIYVDWLCQNSNTTSAYIASVFGAGASFTAGPPAGGANADGNGYLVAMTNPYTVEIVFTSYGATGTPTIYFWDFQPNYAPL